MEQPIRIAQILNKMDSGGIEAVVMNYYRNIDRSKVQFDFYFAEDSEFPQKEELEKMGAGIYPTPKYSKPIAYHRYLYRAFLEHQYMIVHAHLSTMSVFALFAAWRAKVPVRICHNHSTAERREGLRTVLKYVLRPWNRVLATEYFACGDYAGRWMYGTRRMQSGKVTVLPNAIDTQKFRFEQHAREDIRSELGIPKDAFVIGHVGRFMFQKNHLQLLKIFEYMQSQTDVDKEKLFLLLIGEGELMEEMECVARQKMANVIFTGARQDVNKLYSVMDVFCLPSFYEGMPVVAWEAQTNGLGVVFSDRITREAQISSNCDFISLTADDSIWANAIKRVGAKRERVTDECVPDIHKWANWLQEWYLGKA